MASMAWRSSTRGRWQPRGWGLRGGSKGSMRSHSSSGIRQSRRTCVWSSCISVAPVVEKMSLQDTITIAYWDRLLESKYKHAAEEFIWQWFFPAKQLTYVQKTEEYRRYHLHQT